MSTSKAITETFFLPQQGAFTVADEQSGTLGKDDFMKLLIAQLQNQDPTNPMQDREFIAQMAQFSSLEQTVNLTKAFESFAASQQQSQLVEYSSFIGKKVKWHELTGELTPEGTPEAQEGEGVVRSVRFVDGSAEFILEDGKTLGPGNISEVSAE